MNLPPKQNASIVRGLLSSMMLLLVSHTPAYCRGQDVPGLREAVGSDRALRLLPPSPQADASGNTAWSRWSVRGMIAAGESAGGGDIQDAASYELDLNYHFAKRFLLRMGYQTASLDVSRGFPELVHIANARVHIPKFGAFWTRPTSRGRGAFEFGLIGGYESFAHVKPSIVGMQRAGLEQITAKNGLVFGGEVDFAWRPGHTGLLLGGTLSLTLPKDARLQLESPTVGYEDSARWAPLLLGVTVGYRFH